MPETQPFNGVDAFAPAEVARRVEEVGVSKARQPLYRMAALSTLAGAFIGLGSIYFLSVTADMRSGYGLSQLVGGLVFALGLILVVVAGAELFTGNNLLIMAVVSKQITVGHLLRNWVVVFLFNLVGAVSAAGLAYLAEHWAGGGHLVGARALSVGVAKVGLSWSVLFFRAILCNVLVCLAVWLTQAARTVTDKILAIIFPVSAFVAAGFEHSVANMFFIPYAIWIKGEPEAVAAAGFSPSALGALDWGGLIYNLIPVTLGNIVGGALLVGLVYWVCYRWDGYTLPGRRVKAAWTILREYEQKRMQG